MVNPHASSGQFHLHRNKKKERKKNKKRYYASVSFDVRSAHSIRSILLFPQLVQVNQKAVALLLDIDFNTSELFRRKFAG